MEHEEGATIELLDALIDKRHRSYMSAVRGRSLGTFRARVPMSTMPIYRRWIPRLRDSGPLSIARLVEGDMLAEGVMNSSSRMALRHELDANVGGPPNDPTRCVTYCKVWPKGVEPPDCYCHMRCVPNISREEDIEEVQKAGAISQFCHFHEWIDTSISRRDQQYLAWLKKVDDDVRKSER
ncbi:hypothetical protein C2845_PM17G08970 [Panicum miliaceum]|uniref:Uncharacterized protein n=1 Tax=Panicum miliaceum TaxID=4540 RepID=A0A3L6Q5Q5_PANMI|nr:hypothetical protein C2845_PM17G08970 [Panicum miliaceum]